MPDQPPIVAAITGTRRCGKDTLCRLLAQINPRVRPLAFAAALKDDLAPLIQEHFGFDVRTVEGESKELVRGVLIEWGMAHRARDPLHWIKRVTDQIDKTHASYPSYQAAPLTVLSDCRFVNEAAFLRERYPSFKLIHLIRLGAPEPTYEELKHHKKVAVLADHQLVWGGEDEAGRLAKAREVAAWLGLLPEAKEEGT